MGELQVRSVGLSGGMPVIESDDPIPGLEVESVYIPGPRGLQYGGQFRGTWDMSSGTSGPAAPATDYQATGTSTTIVPDATLTGLGTLYFAARESLTIPLATSGVASASFVIPAYNSVSDTVLIAALFLCNSGATSADIDAAVNGRTPANPTWFVAIDVNLAGPVPVIGHYNNDTLTGDAMGVGNYGDTVYVDFNFATSQLTMTINGTAYGPAALDIGAIPAGQGLKLIAGVASTSPSVVFGAGAMAMNFSESSSPFVFANTSGGAVLSGGGATVTFPTTTGYASNSAAPAQAGKVAIPFTLNAPLDPGTTVVVGLQTSPDSVSWAWNGGNVLFEYGGSMTIADHNTTVATSGEFCLLVDIDGQTASVIVPGGATVDGGSAIAAGCGYPVVDVASGAYPAGVTLLSSSSYSLPTGYQIITG